MSGFRLVGVCCVVLLLTQDVQEDLAVEEGSA